MPDRPAEMHTGGRSPDQTFDDAEWHYHRVPPERVQPDNTIDPMHIQFPDLSSNRGRYSKPWYVLYPRLSFENYAVFKFKHGDVPKTVKSDRPGAQVYNVKTEHVPEPDNYGHCETRLYRGTQHMKKIGPEAKYDFRLRMSRVMSLERRAGESFPPISGSVSVNTGRLVPSGALLEDPFSPCGRLHSRCTLELSGGGGSSQVACSPVVAGGSFCLMARSTLPERHSAACLA